MHRPVIKVELNGMAVGTWEDEYRREILIDIRDIWEHCGVDGAEEADRLVHLPELVRECCVVIDYAYNQGLKEKSLYVPLRHLNDYLYTLTPRPDALGENLRDMQAWLAIEVSRHWEGYHRLEGELKGHLCQWRAALDAMQVLQTHHDDFPGAAGIVIRTTVGENRPLTGMTDRELAAVNLGFQLAGRVISEMRDLPGEVEEAIRVQIREHIRLWDF